MLLKTWTFFPNYFNNICHKNFSLTDDQTKLNVCKRWNKWRLMCCKCFVSAEKLFHPVWVYFEGSNVWNKLVHVTCCLKAFMLFCRSGEQTGRQSEKLSIHMLLNFNRIFRKSTKQSGQLHLHPLWCEHQSSGDSFLQLLILFLDLNMKENKVILMKNTIYWFFTDCK